jgi:hypothetical protein
MGFGTIIIFKVLEEANVGYYKISTNDFESVDFYMCIDKSQQIIKFYLRQDFSGEPLNVINYKEDKPIGKIPGVPTMVFSRAVLQAIKIFHIDSFPESLSHAG